jgi:DNA-binding response OmpR family regulator
VLLADIASNCRAAQSARLAWPQLSLVAWHGQQVGPEQAALLSVGVDYVLRPGDPPALLVSVLLALAYRRVHFGATVRPGLLAQWDHAGGDLRIGPWRLVDLGWALEYEGASLRLSVSERALLLCLFEAPGHVASHAELIAAVLRVWQPRRRAPIRDPRCRSTISRLRRRACGAGMPTPPIESLRDFGYAWAL